MDDAVAELQSIDFYRQIFCNNEAIKLLVDPAGGAIVDANEAAAAFYGYPVDTLRTMNIHSINALSQSEITTALTNAKDRTRTRFRFPHRLASGEIRQVEVYTGPLNHRGRPLLLSIIQDMTERERAESELARSEAKQRSLVEALPVGVIVHRDGKVVHANPCALRMLGRERDELIGSDIGDQLVEPGRARLQRRDGTTLEAEVNLVPIHFDGAASVMALVADTTERDRLEEQLRKAQRLDGAGRLAGGLAHDFNNLIAVILATTAWLSRKLPADPALHEHVGNIDGAARRAASLVRQLLLFARGAEPAPEPVDLETVLSELAPLLRGMLGPSVELVIRSTSARCPVAVGRTHLEQVLVNLAVNARDAMPDGGTLMFALTHVDTEGRRHAILVVRDTGIGMTDDVARHVFEPFFTTKPHGRGTGLGLAITYGIVQAAGGSIELASSPGNGTTFTLRFPLRA